MPKKFVPFRCRAGGVGWKDKRFEPVGGLGLATGFSQGGQGGDDGVGVPDAVGVLFLEGVEIPGGLGPFLRSGRGDNQLPKGISRRERLSAALSLYFGETSG